MKTKKNKNGFTLVELLVAISILGLITIIALPQISNIQNQNKTTKYKKYAETMLTSGKLYVDAYTEDMFGNNTSGCVDIKYSEMKKKDLLKEIKVDGSTCSSANTFIRVRKSNDHYLYETSILCKDKNGQVVYEQVLDPNGCNGSGPDEAGPTIAFEENGADWTKGTNLKTKILVYDDYGMLENTKIKYVWIVNGSNVGDYQTVDFQNKRYEGTTSSPLTHEITVPQGVSGKYYLKVEPIDVRDANGNYRLTSETSNAYKLDNTKPTCASIQDNDSWTASDVTVKVTCSDLHSGCKKTTYTESYTEGTTRTGSLTIKDIVGNTTTCSYNVYSDQEAPNAPTNGTMGAVSGSNANAQIQTASSATTDVNNGSGFKEIRYVVKTVKKTPAKSEFTSTSRAYTRACGQTNYAYSVAVDNVGNISSVHYIGSSSDAADVYDSTWSTCTAKCNGGMQYKYNTCDLMPTLSQECNTQDCCSSTTTTWSGTWSSCSKPCNTGTKTMAGTKYSDYDGRSCGADSKSTTCNTQTCCSKTQEVEWGSWGSCSVSCGGGIKYRTGYIYSYYDDDYLCDTESDSASCETQSCCSSTYEGGYGSWGSCSATCGGGTQYRDVYLYSSYNSTYCGVAATQDSQSCGTNPCSCSHVYGGYYNSTSGAYANYWTTTASRSYSYDNCTHGAGGTGHHDISAGQTLYKGQCINCGHHASFTWCPFDY